MGLRHIFRIPLLAALLPLLLMVGCATTHGPGTTPTPGAALAFNIESQEPLTAAAMQGRLAAVAYSNQDRAPVAQVTFMALSVPPNMEAYDAMNGFGLLWITTMGKDRHELPLHNVRLYTNRVGIFHLNPVVTFVTLETDRRITQVLGHNRFDGVYLIPIYRETIGSQITVDFQGHRSNFLLGTLDWKRASGLDDIRSIDSGWTFPVQEQIVPVVKRMFPILDDVALRRQEQVMWKIAP